MPRSSSRATVWAKVTSEMANVTPGGYFYKVSGLKGKTTYKEAYGFVYNIWRTIGGSGIPILPVTLTPPSRPVA